MHAIAPTTLDTRDRGRFRESRPRSLPRDDTARSFQLTPNILSNEDAAERVRAYQKGLRAQRRLQKGGLTPTQSTTARRDAAAGERAAQALVESMLKLATRIVREIAEARHGREGAVPMLEDLMSEASVVILEVAKTFSPAKSSGFSQRAAQSVRNHIRSLVTEDTPSGHKIYSSWARIRRRAIPERHDLAVELGREPTMTELKEHMLTVCLEWAYQHLKPEEQNLNPDERRDVAMAKLRKQGTLSAIEHLEEVLNTGAHPLRLDSPIGESEGEPGATWGSQLAADGAESEAHDRVVASDLRTTLMAAIQHLAEREQTILLYRFGFVDGEVWTYRTIGEMFQISAERVRQVEEQVRTYLRTESPYAAELAEYLST